MANMFASTVFSAGGLLAIFLVLGIAVNRSQSQSFEEEDSLEALGDDVVFQENEDGTPSNRVLPVDDEHGSKISFPTSPLEASCVKMLKHNLLMFLKRVKRSEGKRKGKQDDGDDGDGEDGEGIQGVINNLAEGNGALSVLGAVPAALPQLVNTLTQFSSAINQGLNGTDTPDIPSFLAKQGMDAVKFFQAITGGGNHQAHAPPQVPTIHVQKIPGSEPVRKPRPPAPGAPNYEYPTDPDYPDEEDVKQPQQPSLKPLKPGETANGKYPGVEQIPGSNPFFQGDLQPGGIRRPNAKPTADPNAQFLDGLPSRTSLWSIYKSFRNNGLANGTLTNFQLAHPDAFSNELLQSISQSISSNRGQAAPLQQQGSTDRPASEILQQLFPTGKPSAFASLSRPTLSVYKPSVSNSGIGIDLSNIALNHTNNIIDENEQPNAANNEYDSEEATSSPSNQEQQELDASDVEGVRKRVPGGSGSTSNFGYTHLQQSNQGGQQHSQQFESPSNGNGNAQFVKSPTSSHLTIQMGSYVPAISSLHEGDDETNKVGPQTNFGDNANGFRNKAPYNKVKGVLIEAPRLTPSPYLNLKRPAGLTGNFGGFNSQNPTTTTPTPPNLSYQFSHQQKPASLYPPGASSYRPSDPNAPRAPALIASIPSSFQLSQNPLKNSGIVPSSLIPNSGNPTPETETLKVAITAEPSFIPAKVEPEEDLGAPEENDNEGISTSNNAAPRPAASDVSPTPQFNSSVNLLSLYQKLGNQPIQSQLLANTLLNGNVKEAIQYQPEEITTKASILALASPSNSGLKFSSSLTANQAPQKSQLVSSLLGNLKVPQSQTTANSEPQLEIGKDDGNLNPSSISKEPETLTTLSVSTSPVSTEPQEDIVSSISSTPIPIPARVQPEENNSPESIQSPLSSFFPFPIAPQFLPAELPHNQLPHLIYFPTPSTSTSTTPEPTTIRASPVFNQYGGAGASIKNNLVVTGNYVFQPNSQLQGFPSAINLPVNSQNQFFNTPGVPPKNQARNETVKPKPKPTTTTTPRPTSSNIIGGTYSFANLVPSPLFPSHIQNAINAAPTGTPVKGGPFQPFQPPTGNIQQSQLFGQKPYLPNIALKPPPNSNKAQQVPFQSTTFPPFATAIDYIPNKNNHLQAPPRQTTTKKPTTTTTPKPQAKPVHQNYQFITAGLPVSSIYSPQAPPEKEFKPLIVSNQGFQNLSPVQNAGYPSYVPSTGSGSSSPGFQGQKPNYGSNAELPPSAAAGRPQKPNYGRPGVISDVLAQAQQNLIPNTPHVLDSPQSPQTGSFNESFSETLATKNVSMSAIVEMAKLPYYQEDSFRPSAIPPHILISENEDYSLEKVDGETNTKSPTISELFSSISKASQNQNQKVQVEQTASSTSAPLTTETTTIKISTISTTNPVASVTVEDDYSDQENPNFSTGKPAYWMNMYYPSGVPVLTKVRTTTTVNPNRRRRRTTPFATTPETTEGTEADSDEYDDGSSITKRKKVQT